MTFPYPKKTKSISDINQSPIDLMLSTDNGYHPTVNNL